MTNTAIRSAWAGLALGATLWAIPAQTSAQVQPQTQAGRQALPAVAVPGPQAISAADRETGAKSNPDLVAEFGGAYAGPQAALVRRVGLQVARQSGIADADRAFTVTLLNSPVENAFAVPGGYVYVTRALLALMNDEAELAFVLGHEVGHVAARHADRRQKVTQRNVLLGTLGQAVLGGLLGKGATSGIGGQLVQGGVQRLVVGNIMSHSRSDEFEADDLGVIYAQKAGYASDASARILSGLAQQTALDAQVAGDARTTPRWAMSHPDPALRVTRALDRARQAGVSSGRRDADAFLLALKGMIYDDDPAQGVIDGQSFRYAPDRVTFTAPAGYGMSNGTQSVTITATDGRSAGRATFSGGAYDGNLPGFVGKVLAGLNGGKAVDVPVTRGTINGLATATASVTARDANGAAQDVTVVAYALSARTAYAFTVLQPQGAGLGALAPLVSSLRPMTAAEAGAVRARVIDVVPTVAGDTVTRMAARMAYTDHARERFLVLNGLPAETERLVPGRKVKLVVWGPAGKY